MQTPNPTQLDSTVIVKSKGLLNLTFQEAVKRAGLPESGVADMLGPIKEELICKLLSPAHVRERMKEISKL